MGWLKNFLFYKLEIFLFFDFDNVINNTSLILYFCTYGPFKIKNMLVADFADAWLFVEIAAFPCKKLSNKLFYLAR